MTNKLVVIIKSLKVTKIKELLLYEIKFLVPNYSCIQNPWLRGRGYCPQIPILCPQLNLLNPPSPWTKFLGTPLVLELSCWNHHFCPTATGISSLLPYSYRHIFISALQLQAYHHFCPTATGMSSLLLYSDRHVITSAIQLQAYHHFCPTATGISSLLPYSY